MDAFTPPTRSWFESTFDAPTPVQVGGWPRIASGEHCLLIAPTGSGKTLAAFLWCIDRLTGRDEPQPGVRVLYVSPLKALVYDIERNLRVPLEGIARTARGLDGPAGQATRMPRVAVRTGDTTQRERRLQARDPAEILVTTPESLYLILGSAAAQTLTTVETVIVDEVHALAPTKRGAHLALSLERLSRLTVTDPQRIGLSATVRPAALVARFLGGDRPVSIVDTSEKPRLDLQIEVPVPDMGHPGAGAAPDADGRADDRHSLWPSIHTRLLELIRAHRSTIVFVNSRGLCERLCQRINELAAEGEEPGGEVARAHHGSLAHERRREIEEELKAGEIRAIVATSSLELGIDMAAVDLVLMVESPGSASRGLQRVGRSGHRVGEVSRGRLLPKHRGDLLESAVVVRRMLDGEIEPIRVPSHPLDVLAQQIVAQVSTGPVGVDQIEAMCRRTASYAELPRAVLESVLDMLSGRYPSTEFADLRPRIIWDRESDRLSARRGSKTLALVSGGTIPDRGMYAVTLGPGGPRLGELDEEMVNETPVGQPITLGASTWRIEEVSRDRVIVSPAPGEVGKLPFWHGDGPGRPIELGLALGELLRTLEGMPGDEAEHWLRERFLLDSLAASNLVRYVTEQHAATGTLPTDRAITIERFRDELGDWRVCILTPFGGRVHAPWALALEARLGVAAGFEVQALWSDDGIALRFVGEGEIPGRDVLVPRSGEVEDLVVEQLGHSALFAAQFRENAARALFLPRQRPGKRMPLWAQRIRAQQLLAVARGYPSFPIVLETYRSCMQDVFDLPSLESVLADVEQRRIRVDEVETPSASPFARSLVFAYVAAYMYAYAHDGDLPVAERRAHALTLDRRLLSELLGRETLRDLLDAAIIDQLEDELQRRAPGFPARARHADELHDVLRSVGDLDDEEVAERCAERPLELLDELERSRRAVRIEIRGQRRWIATEDAGLYRDALGAAPPPGVPGVFLAAVAEPLESLLRRWARTHGPFVTRVVARRYDLLPAHVDAALRGLEARDLVLAGDFRPGCHEPEWCDPDVLRTLRRRTLAKLRGEVAPVEGPVLARFLPRWQGVGEPLAGPSRLQRVVEQLEGLPMSFTDLERSILPARVPGFQPRHLDDLGATGGLVWIGCGSLGGKDGRIALFRRTQVNLLWSQPQPFTPADTRHERLLEHLERHGASFLFELLQCCPGVPEAELVEALWDLVWAGHVTNDTLHSIRVFGAPARSRSRRSGSASWSAGGRWSLTRHLVVGSPSPTAKAHARALALLGRYGVVSREVVAAESSLQPSGQVQEGAAQVFAVLRALEDVGKVRRGFVVDGLSGAQYAFAGAVDQLRAARTLPDDDQALVLATTDPANPYGAILPWPPVADPTGGLPRRVAGSAVVLVGGEPVLFLERAGRRALTFGAARDEAKLAVAAKALGQVAARRRGKFIRLETIDGGPARSSSCADALRRSGFTEDPKGLVLEVR